MEATHGMLEESSPNGRKIEVCELFWLVVTGTWLDYDCPETVGNVIGPQLTNSLTPSFFRGVGEKPPTSNLFNQEKWLV